MRSIIAFLIPYSKKQITRIQVAFQLIHGLIRGGIVRRRARIKRDIIRARFHHAKDMFGGKEKEKSRMMLRGALSARQRMISQVVIMFIFLLMLCLSLRFSATVPVSGVPLLSSSAASCSSPQLPKKF